MVEKRERRPAPSLLFIPCILSLLVFAWTVSCGPSSPVDPSPTEVDSSSTVTGLTSSRSETTVLPPPPPPERPRNRGILLASDRDCPTCTLVTPRGTALVWFNTQILREAEGGGVAPMSFDELNAALMPGQPLDIRVDNLEATQPVAQILIVERRFHTTGSADRSSADVSSSGELVLAVQDEIAGRVDIPYVLDSDAVVEAFSAGDRIFISGVVVDGQLRLKLVRPDV